MAVSENSFVTGSQDRTFRGWSVQNEGFVTEFNILTDNTILCTAINETQTLIALGLRNGNVELYKADNEEVWKFHSTIQCHNSEVLCLSWNDSILATGGRDRYVHIIQVELNSHIKRELANLTMHTSTVNAVHWIKGEQYILYVTYI